MAIVHRFYAASAFVLLAMISAGTAQSAPLDLALPAQSVAISAVAAPAGAPPAPPQSTDGGWFARVDKAQASQPGWITPLMTVTPRLEEEVRYDQYYEHQGTGATLINDDGGKGIELIPTTTNEIIFNVPPYETRTNFMPASGFGDDAFFLVKQRMVSKNAQNGDYIVTAFLSVLGPTGDDAFSNHAWVVTPTIAAGKGWGPFDVQGTVGVGLPTGDRGSLGNAVATNVAFQYHVEKFWPEFEVNDTYWSGGERGGKNQVLLTPGVIVGRFKLGGRFKCNFGLGYQFAVAPAIDKEPLTPQYSDAWISTFRVSF